MTFVHKYSQAPAHTLVQDLTIFHFTHADFHIVFRTAILGQFQAWGIYGFTNPELCGLQQLQKRQPRNSGWASHDFPLYHMSPTPGYFTNNNSLTQYKDKYLSDWQRTILQSPIMPTRGRSCSGGAWQPRLSQAALGTKYSLGLLNDALSETYPDPRSSRHTCCCCTVLLSTMLARNPPLFLVLLSCSLVSWTSV